MNKHGEYEMAKSSAIVNPGYVIQSFFLKVGIRMARKTASPHTYPKAASAIAFALPRV
jgi:hypothetical protein